MAKWFARLFHDEENSASAASRASDPLGRPAALTPDDIAQSEDYDDWAGSTPRRVLEPPVLMDTPEPAPGQVGGIRILARLAPEQSACVFMVDRPVLRGHSAWFRHITESDVSPLAQRLYEADGVTSVLLYEANVTVGRSPFEKSDWETWARDVGARLRAFLETGAPAVSEAFLAGMPSEDQIRERLERVLETEINPGIAAHSGAIYLERVEGNTVYIRMMGGCQGCAASSITLRQGVEQVFRDVVPRLGAVLDVTDHDAGANPFYRNLPAGMNANG